MAKKFPKT